MPKSSTPSFVLELALVSSSSDKKQISSKFSAARQLYNACLGEAKVRMMRVKNSLAYKAALEIPKTQKKERQKAFNSARMAYRYSEYDLQAFALSVAKASKWIYSHLDSHTIQTTADRAFKAVERIMYGQARSVRFKPKNRYRSIEGKSNRTSIRFDLEQFKLVWGSLRLSAVVDLTDAVILHGINTAKRESKAKDRLDENGNKIEGKIKPDSIKYCRLIRRELNGKEHYFIQLVIEGNPYSKPKNFVADGLIGMDLNICNVAICSDNKAELFPLASLVPSYSKQIAAIQRKLERSRRINNPDNYEPDFKVNKGKKKGRTVKKRGKVKKGCRRWNNSKTYRKVSARKREIERKRSAYAKCQNRKLVNDTLRMGKHIRTECVSVKAWQKRYGKAISLKSPGFFQSHFQHKAEKAGGSMIKFSTNKTALSQTHLDGSRTKKSLSERVHYDATGKVMHRDLFVSFLARHVNEDQLSLQDAVSEYPRLEPVLMEAWERFKKSVSQLGASESKESHSPSERISTEPRKTLPDSQTPRVSGEKQSAGEGNTDPGF